ncbi:response regulator transcription factor [Oscillatoria sp. FACHB-1407]|uniref:response regulator n=1 Tax=Oscillatoria sp. FACHB-1407 TaxID=2692847 RepID=UPI001687B07E|nr:response regulator transcription factor [Oscillatoria sp. FACHB-1407]MBD2463579.1 response regulator transcription factor [Oscillatoria sp. FACHB-1407]
MNPEAQIRILIADDHPVVRQGLAAMIGRKPGMAVVAEASDGREAVDLFRQHRPDVTLMDLRMPGMDGVQAIALLKESDRHARIIILTTYDTDEDIYRGLSAGAMAYILKGASPDELIDTIRVVHNGQTRIPSAVAAKLAARINSPNLTSREMEVLQLIVAGQSNKEISVSLQISEGTVRAHVNNLLSKLGVSDRTQATTLALRKGLVRLE